MQAFRRALANAENETPAPFGTGDDAGLSARLLVGQAALGLQAVTAAFGEKQPRIRRIGLDLLAQAIDVRL